MNQDGEIRWKKWSKMGISKKEGGLGFRNVECFNQAMLANQFWRILVNHYSMIAMIMKGKYFKTSSILFAKLGHGSSQIWKSIWGLGI